MNTQILSTAIRTSVLSLLAAASLAPQLASAGPPGHGFAVGGFHGGGSAFHGGSPAFHGSYGGGWHGGHGYAYRGGGYGWHGGYGHYGWRPYYGWGWWGWPVGAAFLATLPLYYSTYWWNGVPYYYAYDNYYVWDNTAGGYTVVAPPAGVVSQVPADTGAPAPGTAPAYNQLFVYPRNGQSEEQTARDRQECQQWAAGQANGGGDNLRAQTACLEGRGYSVR